MLHSLTEKEKEWKKWRERNREGGKSKRRRGGRKRREEVKKDAHYPGAYSNVGECNHLSNFPGVP